MSDENSSTHAAAPVDPPHRTLFPPMDVPPLMARVVDAGTELPLAGVLVRWVAPAAGGTKHHLLHRLFDREAERVTVLGEAVSGDDGGIVIALSQSPEARQAACGLSWRTEAQSYLILPRPDSDDDSPLEGIEPVEVTVAADEIVVRVTSGAEPDVQKWSALAGYLGSNRIYRTEELGLQLTTPFSDSPVRFWSAPLRSAALGLVSRALGDVDGAVPMPLLEQPHLVNLDALATGDVVKAVNNFRSAELYEQFGGKASEWYGGVFAPTTKSDLALYRDYLRGVWVIASRRMNGTGPADASLEQQIVTRFHQNFSTADDTPQPAATQLVALLRSVLIGAANREGFGFTTATLPVQGTATDAEYLSTLIGATKQSAAELRNRFRVRLDRAAGERVSPVQLNVEALLGLLADTYQSPEEPFPTTLRGVDPERPLIFAPYTGRAPFFLEFEEWLDRQRRFYPENVYDIRRTLPVFDKKYRDAVEAQKTVAHGKPSVYNDYIANDSEWHASATWLTRLFAITDAIRAALTAAEKQIFPEALGLLDSATSLIADARKNAPAKWTREPFVWFNQLGNPNDFPDRRVTPKARAVRPVTTPAQLAEFEAFFDAREAPHLFSWENFPGPDFNDRLEAWLSRARTISVQELKYFAHVLIPYLRATIMATQGNHPGAVKLLGRITGYDVGIAQSALPAGYANPTDTLPPFYRDVALPYTTSLTFDTERHWYDDQRPHADLPAADQDIVRVDETDRPLIAPFEHRFFKLAQAEEMLLWADELYRTDEPSAIRRARELYKGVVFLHGEDPGIAPHFKVPGLLTVPLTIGQLGIGGMETNPARSSQLARAHANVWQIDEGLNVYGYRDDMVPVLRYKPLKQAADLFATSGKSAQADFLQYQTRFEQATIEGWQAAMMVKKSEAGVGIATEHTEIAKAGVGKAQEQVAAVKAQIEAKKKEIADSSSLFNQAKDFFGGIKDSLTGMVPLAEKAGNDQSAAGGSPTNEQLMALAGKSFNGASASQDAAAAALGSGAALTIGFAAFAYYGYTTMQGMADAMAKRDGELKSLQTTALGAAEAQVTLKQRDVTIANYEKQIAQAELDFARALDRYQRDRFLNVDLWNKLAAFAQRTMKRYIELGARAGWLAERALAFEQNRAINTIRLNYVPTANRGLTGADRLLLDLAELEANRLQGIRLTAPVKQTLSLARDLPVSFGQLKRTGRCAFHTSERTLQAAYPGTFGYRIRAVTVAAHDADGPSPRGVLRNLGASLVLDETGTAPKVLVRFPDALPLSEFRLNADMAVYGLPGESLLQFEGSGYETDWEIELPIAANPRGLRSLADILITCDMNAMYSQTLATKMAAVPPAPVTRAVALSASVWDPDGLASLSKPGAPARIRFDLAKLSLAAQEKDRKITNLALLLVGKTEQVYSATIQAAGAVKPTFTITDGLALSNAGPLLGAAAALPLNAFVGEPVGQALVLEIDKAGVAGELAALDDVVLYVEYGADLV